MAEYEINLTGDQVKGLLTSDDGLKGLVETVVNQVLDAQMTEHLAAGRYEHRGERKGYRNGHRPRRLYARIGKLVIRVPQSRDGVKDDMLPMALDFSERHDHSLIPFFRQYYT